MSDKLDDMTERIGETVGTSDWITIDQAMIDKFADATHDHQFIHVNPEMASYTPLGGTVAHGFLTLSLLSHFHTTTIDASGLGVKMALNYGSDRVRFLTPVRAGKRVRAHFKLLAIGEKRPGQWQQTLECTIEIEGEDKPALVAEWINQFFV